MRSSSSLRPFLHASIQRMPQARAGRMPRLGATRRRRLLVEEMEGRTLLSGVSEFPTPTAYSTPLGSRAGPTAISGSPRFPTRSE
jgi:hypothetical protein